MVITLTHQQTFTNDLSLFINDANTLIKVTASYFLCLTLQKLYRQRFYGHYKVNKFYAPPPIPLLLATSAFRLKSSQPCFLHHYCTINYWKHTYKNHMTSLFYDNFRLSTNIHYRCILTLFECKQAILYLITFHFL